MTSIPRLQLLWSRTLNGRIASPPSVARGKVYVGDWDGTEWALNPVTGAIVASADLGKTTAKRCNPPVAGISSSPAISGNRLYVAGGDDGFYALDADTLETVWRRSLGHNSAAGGYYGWGSPAVAGGKVLQGIASNCDDPFPRGALVALDPATGKNIATTYFVPEDLVGGGVWTSPAVDSEHRKIFVTTGSADSFGDGDAYSMVRLDLDTLQIEDGWKHSHDKDLTWDADWGSSPTLFSDAAGRRLVGAGQKDGGYYAFDRSHLASGPLWISPVGTFSDDPRNANAVLSTAVFDGKLLYVGGRIPSKTEGQAALGMVSAVAPGDGKILWRRTFDEPIVGPVSFANGVVFAVEGKSVVALDAASGSILWSFNMKSWGVGGVAIAHGRIYAGDWTGRVYAFGVSAI